MFGSRLTFDPLFDEERTIEFGADVQQICKVDLLSPRKLESNSIFQYCKLEFSSNLRDQQIGLRGNTFHEAKCVL